MSLRTGFVHRLSADAFDPIFSLVTWTPLRAHCWNASVPRSITQPGNGLFGLTRPFTITGDADLHDSEINANENDFHSSRQPNRIHERSQIEPVDKPVNRPAVHCGVPVVLLLPLLGRPPLPALAILKVLIGLKA